MAAFLKLKVQRSDTALPFCRGSVNKDVNYTCLLPCQIRGRMISSHVRQCVIVSAETSLHIVFIITAKI